MAKKVPADNVTPVKARVLTNTFHDGASYQANDVLTATESVIKELEGQGLVDSDEDAVAYAESLKDSAA